VVDCFIMLFIKAFNSRGNLTR